MESTCETLTREYAREGWGKTILELDILQKFYCFYKGD